MNTLHIESDHCPHCKASMQGNEIPVSNRWLYGGKTHFTRVVTVMKNGDVVGYRCPDCDYTTHLQPAMAA